MADKRIIDLPVFTGGTKLKQTDILPTNNSSGDITEQVSGEQLMNGVFDTTNQTLFNNMHYNEDKVTRLTSEKVITPVGGSQYIYQKVATTYINTGYTTMQTWLIKFKVMVTDVNNNSNTSEYTAVFMQNVNGSFIVPPTGVAYLLVLSTTVGASEPGKTLVKMYENIQGSNPISSVEVIAMNYTGPSAADFLPDTFNKYNIFIKVNAITSGSIFKRFKIISETITPQF